MAKAEDLKEKNYQTIRNLLINQEIWTKNDLYEHSLISKSSITTILKELMDCNEINYIGDSFSTGGRKSKQYLYNKDYYHTLKVILSRKESKYLISIEYCNLKNEILETATHTDDIGSISFIQETIAHYKQYPCNLICISIPGVCEQGILTLCDFTLLVGINIINTIQSIINVPVIVENDVNVAAIGLYHKLDVESLAFLYQPDVEYVGCGMMIHHKLYNGATHFAGELRFLPFYNHQQQDEMLHSNPLELLRLQTDTLCCVMNPEVICIASDVLNQTDIENMKLSIPINHQPKIIYVQDIHHYIYDGLYDISIDYYKENM